MPSFNPAFCLAVLSLFSVIALLLRTAYLEGYRDGVGRTGESQVGRTRFH